MKLNFNNVVSTSRKLGIVAVCLVVIAFLFTGVDGDFFEISSMIFLAIALILTIIASMMLSKHYKCPSCNASLKKFSREDINCCPFCSYKL